MRNPVPFIRHWSNFRSSIDQIKTWHAYFYLTCISTGFCMSSDSLSAGLRPYCSVRAILLAHHANVPHIATPLTVALGSNEPSSPLSHISSWIWIPCSRAAKSAHTGRMLAKVFYSGCTPVTCICPKRFRASTLRPFCTYSEISAVQEATSCSGIL